MAEHATITDPNVHEPKGITSASTNEVYVADGANSGTWSKLGPDSLIMASIKSDIEDAIDVGDIQIKQTFYLTTRFTDVSTSDEIYVAIPEDCTFIEARCILGAAISGANSTVTFYDADGNSMGTGLTVAHSGSAAGDDYVFTPSSEDDFTAGSFMRIVTNGNSTGTATFNITLKFEVPIT